MGNHIGSVVNIDRKEKILITALGEHHKWSYHFGGFEHSLVLMATTWLTVFRDQGGVEPDSHSYQGSWVGDRVMFCGDGFSGWGQDPGWDVDEVYTEARGYEDITLPVLSELCECNSDLPRILAERCLQQWERPETTASQADTERSLAALVVEMIRRKPEAYSMAELRRLLGDRFPGEEGGQAG